MIPENQKESFIKAMLAKGYTANYAAPGVRVSNLSYVLNTYLNERLYDGVLGRAFPFWIGTLVEGKNTDHIHTLAHFKIGYNVNSGFEINEYKLMTWDRKQDNMEVTAHHKINSIAELPTRTAAQKICPRNTNRTQKRNRRKL